MCVCMQASVCMYSVCSLGCIVGCLSKEIQGKIVSIPDIVERDIALFNGKQRVQSSKDCLQSRPYVISVLFMFAW